MKKSISTAVQIALVASLVSYGGVANAGALKIQMQLTSVNFVYDPAQHYDIIGSDVGPELTDVTFATFRDATLNDGDGNGSADDTFGNLDYGSDFGSILYTYTDDDGATFSSTYEYNTAPLKIDFRVVLEEPVDPMNPNGDYNVLTNYSYFDILTRDDTNDWGLALNAAGTTSELSIHGSQGNIATTFLAGELFEHPDSNNLPFVTIDPLEEIQFSFNFDVFGLADWSQLETGRGNGTVMATVPEPTALALWGAGLMLAGFAGKRRRKNKA